MLFALWLIAVILVVWGVFTLFRGEVLLGIVLIVVGLLVGPGGVSIVASSAPALERRARLVVGGVTAWEVVPTEIVTTRVVRRAARRRSQAPP